MSNQQGGLSNQVPILVYTKPNCQPCKATKRHLKRMGLEFEELDASNSLVALEVERMGFKSLPVIVAGEIKFSGYRPDLLGELAWLETQ